MYTFMEVQMNESLETSTREGKAAKGPVDWARIWFSRLAHFHGVHDPAKWVFSEAEVVAFLRAKLKQGMPAWKRLMIVKGLILYRNKFLRSKEPRLEHMRVKLQELSVGERNPSSEGRIDDVVGKINPNEPDVIQEMRRTLRRQGKSYNTEKAYVKWVRRFMAARSLQNLADFESMNSSDVESFLTDLAVDGGVAAATQEQAFFGLLFLFEYVLKVDVRGVDAMRSDKPKLVPTVLSKQEVAGFCRR